MKIIVLMMLAILVSCEQNITVQSASGKISTLKVDSDNILSTSKKIEKIEKTEVFNDVVENCSHPSVCCKCGFTLSGDYTCECGPWINCPGTRFVSFELTKIFYRIEYLIKEKKEKVTYQSPVDIEYRKNILKSTECR